MRVREQPGALRARTFIAASLGSSTAFDVMAIVSEVNPTEYDRGEHHSSAPAHGDVVHDVRRIVREQFARWFEDDAASDPPRDAAAEIWDAWRTSPP